jgi:hypothetical protein
MAGITEVVSNISDDLKTIAKNEVALVKLELQESTKSAAYDAALIVIGGIIALTGISMLCVALVVALAPVLPPLWLRLVLVAIVYVALGSIVIMSFVKRMKKDVSPDLSVPVEESKQTIDRIKEGLSQ